MADQYIAFNAAPPTTGVMTAVSTGTAIKTLLQLTAGATDRMVVVEWGIQFDGSPAAIRAELVVTTTVAGGAPTAVTPTALTDGAPASATLAGFSPTSEGTIVATTRVFETQVLSANSYSHEYSLGREPMVGVNQVLRIRVLAAAAVNALCWVRWEE